MDDIEQLKKSTPTKIMWLDMEMTGLDPTKDRIVEVAAIITDWDFKELDVFDSGVYQDPQEVKDLFNANPWAVARPNDTKELTDLSAGSPPESQVEARLVDLVNRYVSKDQVILLAGNSIHCDRGFIQQWMPELNKRIHYRMLDVSAWKVVMQGKYRLLFKKQEKHRALDDIRESMAELKFYLRRFDLEKAKKK
jgi:oligoribonuclease